ncbi:MAG TPA: PKD domain-containing protein [Thermoanaerobaculia bacterium]
MKSSRLSRCALCAVVGLVGWSVAAYGCSASFLGNCSYGGGNNPADCMFSVLWDCGSAQSTGCSWDFGDGNSGNACSLASHTYSNPANLVAVLVQFTLTCSDSCQVTAQRNLCFTIGQGGCIEPNNGWN